MGAALGYPAQATSHEYQLLRNPSSPAQPPAHPGLDLGRPGWLRVLHPQVTGKFRGGVNPFTRGCCGNVEHVLCSPLAPR